MAAEKPILQYMPALATLVDAPPEGDDYFHELKADGFRMSLQLEHGRVRWTSRHGKSWTHELPELVEAARSLDIASVVLDGELVVLTPSGLTSFQGLQNTLRARAGSRPLSFFAFDLLHLAGRDLTKTPLEKRKELLLELVAPLGASHPIRYTDHIVGDGARFFERAQALGVEGVVSKRRLSIYRPGRTRDWLKTKCPVKQDFVVCGYTEPFGDGGLLLGHYDANGRLMYAGAVRTGRGFTREFTAQLRAQLATIRQPSCPYAEVPRSRSPTHWVRPILIVEVAYTEKTADGKLRHPSVLGFRTPSGSERVVLLRGGAV